MYLALFVCILGIVKGQRAMVTAYGSLLLATICGSSFTPYTIQDDQFIITPQITLYCSLILFIFLLSGAVYNQASVTITIGLLYQLQSSNLIVTFISLEQINISLYVLICTYSSGIKYIITSQIVTTLFVLGLSFVGENWSILLLPTFLLKLGIFPFHQLTADLYDGLPTKIMMIVQLPIKLGIYLFILNAGAGYVEVFGPIQGLAILIPAISTSDSYTFKRFISLSSSSYQTQLFMGVLGYATYSLANYAIVYILTLTIIMRVYGSPIVTIQFLSIAGMPPFIGFYYKAKQVSDQLNTEAYWLLVLFLASSLILTANYLERTSTTVISGKAGVVLTTTTSQVLLWSIIG